MKPSELIKAKRDEILNVAKQFAIKNIRVFGSAANGKDSENSDLDLLIDTTNKTTLLDLCGLKIELEELLGIKVDVLTPNSIPMAFRQEVLNQARLL